MEFAQTNRMKSTPNKVKFRMFIIELLESGHNKIIKDQIVNWVGDSQDKFDVLFNILFTEEYRLVQRAAWPVSYIVQKHPGLIQKHMKTVSQSLNDKNLKDAVKRNLLRFLQNITISKKYSGSIADACFGFITNPHEKAAIKAFSITVLENISRSFPELKTELKLILEEVFEFGTSAFRSRARKIISDKGSRNNII